MRSHAILWLGVGDGEHGGIEHLGGGLEVEALLVEGFADAVEVHHFTGRKEEVVGLAGAGGLVGSGVLRIPDLVVECADFTGERVAVLFESFRVGELAGDGTADLGHAVHGLGDHVGFHLADHVFAVVVLIDAAGHVEPIAEIGIHLPGIPEVLDIRSEGEDGMDGFLEGAEDGFQTGGKLGVLHLAGGIGHGEAGECFGDFLTAGLG